MAPWIVFPLLAIGWIAYYGEGKQQAALKEYTVDYAKVSYDLVASTSHPHGTPGTPIVIAEFGDLMCPACREMHEHVMTFQGKFPTKVSLLFHHFPLSGEVGHELSRYAANLSDQLDPSDFWQFVGSVYGSEEKPDKAALDKLFAACKGKRALTPAQAEAAVGKAIEVGKQYGVKMTPTYILFIDKKPVAFATSANLAQVLSQPEFKAVIEPGK